MKLPNLIYLFNTFRNHKNTLAWVLEDNERYVVLSKAARERALSLWSPEAVVHQYLKVYEEVQNQ